MSEQVGRDQMEGGSAAQSARRDGAWGGAYVVAVLVVLEVLLVCFGQSGSAGSLTHSRWCIRGGRRRR